MLSHFKSVMQPSYGRENKLSSHLPHVSFKNTTQTNKSSTLLRKRAITLGVNGDSFCKSNKF